MKSKEEIGLKAAMNILQKWGVDREGIIKILNIDSAENIEEEQLIRIGCILNLHESLRTLFENPDNIYGFMSMKNDNKPFDGKSPLSLLSTGELEDLKIVTNAIQSLTCL